MASSLVQLAHDITICSRLGEYRAYIGALSLFVMKLCAACKVSSVWFIKQQRAVLGMNSLGMKSAC